MPERSTSRILAVAAITVGVAALALVVFGGGGDYRVKARFVDAGQLVKGALVQVAGRPVGKVTEIALTDDNKAELTLDITEDGVTPLRRGTRATIRTVGLSGVTNRYVEITPGPEAGAEIGDGGILDLTETLPIVDLDTLLNALDPPTRAKLQGIVKDADRIFEGAAAKDANAALHYLNPALAQGRALAGELARDTAAVGRLVTTGAVVARTLAARKDAVGSGITSTAATLRALADERAALEGVLERAPGTLRQARSTLGRARATLAKVRPALREARPVAGPLADVLRRLPGASRQARPVVEQLNALLPGLRTAVAKLPGLRDVAIPAVRSAATTLSQAQPVFEGLRPYAPEVVLGLTMAIGGRAATNFDANGHFARIQFASGGQMTSGLLSTVPQVNLLGGYRTEITARCSGGATEPAPDASNPYVPDPSTCNPDHNRPRP